MIDFGLILLTFGLMMVGQSIHQIVKIKRAHRKFQGSFRLLKYWADNKFVFCINGFLILLIAIANSFVPILVGEVAYLLAGFAVDKTILSIFGNGNGKKK